MFFTEKKRYEAETKGRDHYILALQAWHKKIADKEKVLEDSFVEKKVEKYSINVWDDYPQDGMTYAYVEMPDIPGSICCILLTYIIDVANNNEKITALGVNLALRYYDSSVVYPTLIGDREAEFCLFKRWEITIDGADYEKLEVIVEELQKIKHYKDKPLDVYSES